jgi:hypothetical protein
MTARSESRFCSLSIYCLISVATEMCGQSIAGMLVGFAVWVYRRNRGR